MRGSDPLSEGFPSPHPAAAHTPLASPPTHTHTPSPPPPPPNAPHHLPHTCHLTAAAQLPLLPALRVRRLGAVLLGVCAVHRHARPLGPRRRMVLWRCHRAPPGGPRLRRVHFPGLLVCGGAHSVSLLPCGHQPDDLRTLPAPLLGCGAGRGGGGRWGAGSVWGGGRAGSERRCGKGQGAGPGRQGGAQGGAQGGQRCSRERQQCPLCRHAAAVQRCREQLCCC